MFSHSHICQEETTLTLAVRRRGSTHGFGARIHLSLILGATLIPYLLAQVLTPQSLGFTPIGTIKRDPEGKMTSRRRRAHRGRSQGWSSDLRKATR